MSQSNRYDPLVVTPPATEAVSLLEIKEQCSIDSSDTSWDGQLDVCRIAARRHYEDVTGRTIHETEYELTLDCFDGTAIALPRATPLLAISEVKYVDSDELDHIVDPALYLVNTRAFPGAVALRYGEYWPTFTPSPVAPVRITYTAGIAAALAMEADADDRLAIRMLAAAMFQNREAWTVGDRAAISACMNPAIDRMVGLRVVKFVA